MNLSSHIAKRYFISRRKKNFINFLTYISVGIVAICCAALIIVLSVFNGIEDLLRSLNNSFDPQLKIELLRGKSFEWTDQQNRQLTGIEGVEYVTEVIEDYAYVKYKGAEMVVTMKGVSDGFINEHRMDKAIVQGNFKLKEGEVNYTVVGQGVQYYLQIWPGDDMNALQVHYIKDVRSGRLDPSSMYSRRSILPSAVFSIQKFYDENYIFVPLEFAEDLLDYKDKRTSLEIKLADGYAEAKAIAAIKEVLGDDFRILNAEQQHADLYKLLKVEKLFVFTALVLIMAVGSINILFVLSMLAIEKKKDIAILFSMGATENLVRRIFLKEGLFISITGAAVGLILGICFVYLQETFGLVSMGMQTAVQNAYPVRLLWADVAMIGSCIIGITFLVSYRPATIAMRYTSLENLQ